MSINTTIIGYRAFSAVCIAILGILGFTHIRKDFGEKVRGIVFIFYIFFTGSLYIFGRSKNVFIGNCASYYSCNLCI